MRITLQSLLAGTEVHARGLRWEIVGMLPQGDQTLVRLRGLEGVMQGKEMDLLHPLEEIHPIQHDLNPAKAVPLQNWVVYHQAFLLELALGESALLSIQQGRLRIEPYQLVPVLRAIRMSRHLHSGRFKKMKERSNEPELLRKNSLHGVRQTLRCQDVVTDFRYERSGS
jgi:hypothetical protein